MYFSFLLTKSYQFYVYFINGNFHIPSSILESVESFHGHLHFSNSTTLSTFNVRSLSFDSPPNLLLLQLNTSCGDTFIPQAAVSAASPPSGCFLPPVTCTGILSQSRIACFQLSDFRSTSLFPNYGLSIIPLAYSCSSSNDIFSACRSPFLTPGPLSSSYHPS